MLRNRKIIKQAFFVLLFLALFASDLNCADAGGWKSPFRRLKNWVIDSIKEAERNAAKADWLLAFSPQAAGGGKIAAKAKNVAIGSKRWDGITGTVPFDCIPEKYRLPKEEDDGTFQFIDFDKNEDSDDG